MTQSKSSPIFTNCSNREIYKTQLCSDCRNCERYESCVRLKANARKEQKAKERYYKRRWRQKRRQRRRQNRTQIKSTFPLLILAILLGVFIANRNPLSAIAFEVDTLPGQIEEVPQMLYQINDVESEEIQEEDAQQDLEESIEEMTTTETEEEESESEVATSEETVVTMPATTTEEPVMAKAVATTEEQPATTEVVAEQPKEEIQEIAEPQVEQEVVESVIEEKGEARISAYEPGESYYYELSKDDKKHIEKLVYKEARGECYKGKVAVAAVVLNRYFSDNPGFNHDSIYGVINQSGAFASISDVSQSMLDRVPDLAEAVEDACRGWDPTREVFESGALYFYAPKEVKGYQKQIREGITVMEIGGHNFHINFNK